MKEFIQNFTDKDIGPIIKLHKSYYLVNEELQKVMKKIPDEAQSAGIYLGEEEKPSLALLRLISKISDTKIFLNEKAAYLFICGRDIMGQSIIKANADEGLVLVQNEKDENLGYGRFIGNINEPEEIVVKNLLDLGNFLRREKR